jgi:hypothetical protein
MIKKNNIALVLLIILLFKPFGGLIYAQDFKPYKVKSGKIVYENIRYSVHSGFTSENGVEKSFRELVPYVAEQVIYYWDNFGDVAFEETYKVAEFGGKALAEKIKISERLWLGEHRYYFNSEKNTVVDDPYHLRIECRENFQYYQIMGSWVKTQYKSAEITGTKMIVGKKASCYKIDESEDLLVWKGLVLENVFFASNRKGDKRYDPDRRKQAVKIDTCFTPNKNIFYPSWLKRKQLFDSLDGDKIGELFDVLPERLLQADNEKGISIKKNDILFFVTSDLRLGKMLIFNRDKQNNLIFRFCLYDNTNVIFAYRDSYRFLNGKLEDLDSFRTENQLSKSTDFKWEAENSILFPINNIGLYLLKSSRKINSKL